MAENELSQLTRAAWAESIWDQRDSAARRSPDRRRTAEPRAKAAQHSDIVQETALRLRPLLTSW